MFKPRILFKKIVPRVIASTSMSLSSLVKIDLFKHLGNWDPTTHTTRVVGIHEFVGEYARLVFGNGGDFIRRDSSGKKMKIAKMRKRLDKVECSWDVTATEATALEQEFKLFAKIHGIKPSPGNGICLIKLCGLQDTEMKCSPREDLRREICKKPCVVCGTKHNVECDHKNDLYNDPRVNTPATQVLDDFQPLCKHCNDQKRQVIKQVKATGKRYPATSIPSLAPFGVDFTRGDESFDPNDINAMVGTYWYDPVAFMKEVRLKYSSAHNTNTP